MRQPRCDTLVQLIETPKNQARTFLAAASEDLAAFLRAHLEIPVHDLVGRGEDVPASASFDTATIEQVDVSPFGGEVAPGDRVILAIVARAWVIMNHDVTSARPGQHTMKAAFMIDIEATAIRTETGYSDLHW